MKAGHEVTRPKPSRGAMGLAGFAAVILLVLVATYVTAGVAYGTCSGDGGDPFAARASTAGRFCESDVATAYFVAEALLPGLLMLISAAIGFRKRQWRFLRLGGVAAALLIVIQATMPLSLSTDCDEGLDPNSDSCATY